ncbi:pre-mRNA cleavage factor Im 25 kDa subunit 1-like isoform X2 [Salvia splendens]|uniref:pre-mRNA cleavage factor Im 25 kDa subunit 1-like isoform X2 n=1 Tax=Salvia splendens TaxID=180675 RepID=UPI001C25608F|nr:pre-mRNA cleavage factor Im 25 kDa subunit 1-like isoform X2 [Salvia splendens]
MGDHSIPEENGGDPSSSTALDIYPLSCYYFGSTDSVSLNTVTRADRLLRLRANYDAVGMRSCVAAAIVVELFKHPHLLLLQVQNSIYKLPGGRLRQGESDIDCLKRKLASKLSAGEDGRGPDWEVGECLGMWWRPDFESVLYPYLPPNIKRPKECTKLYLVKLPPSRRFIVPKNSRLLAIPLCQLHENDETYGPIISGVPQLLSKYSFNMIEP